MLSSRLSLSRCGRSGGRGGALALALAVALFSGPAAACPDWRLHGQRIGYTGADLAAPQSLQVVAGGADILDSCAQLPGTAIRNAPDFDLLLTRVALGSSLMLEVAAPCDTLLLVHGAGGWQIDDDSGGGVNPRLVIDGAQDGFYDIWIAAYGAASCEATLTLQILPPAPPAP